MSLPLLASSLIALQSPASNEPVIVVTARGLDPVGSDRVYDLVDIDRERLRDSPSGRLEDVLRDVPGFQQFRRSDSRSANPTSQGATLRALGGNASARALLLLDGVPQVDPFGGWISWTALDPRRLGHVRVMRGGGTGANGPGALAGTIELTSAGAGEADGLAIELSGGSRDSLDAFAGWAGEVGRGHASLDAAWAQGDGFVPVEAGQRGPVDRPSPYAQGSVVLRGAAPVGGTTEIQAMLSAFTDARERGTALSEIRSKGADASIRLVGRGRIPFSFLLYGQDRAFSNRFASANAARTSVNPTLDQYSVPARGFGARAELRPRLGAAELRLGADWREVEGRTQELYQFSGAAFARARAAGGRSRTLGAFAGAGWTKDALTLDIGARLDRWWIGDGFLRERLLADGQAITDTRFADRGGWEASGRAGAAWRPDPALTVRAAAYRGWRLPTLNELYRPFRVGADATAANPDLAPERVLGAEAGLELRPASALRLGLTLFVNRLDQAISNVTLGSGPGVFPGVGFVGASGRYRQRRNVDAIISRGIELDAGFRSGPWRLDAGYSLAVARISADGPAAGLDGLRPAQAPRHGASATLAWSGLPGMRAAISARYVGAQYEDDQNLVRIPDALTFDALLRLPVTGRLALVGRAENLADARVVAGISGAGIVERAAPRTLWIGLSWRG